MNENKTSLKGKTVYIPRMSYEGARAMAAALKAIGIDAEPVPSSDHNTLALGKKFSSGDECHPQTVTLGGFLKILQKPAFDPDKTAFLMPMAGGPCRFGQYSVYVRKVLAQLGYPNILVFSPTGENSYDGFGEQGKGFPRIAWRAVVASDVLRKMLLKTRPYETTSGTTDAVFEQSLDLVCDAIGNWNGNSKIHLENLIHALTVSRDRFRQIPCKYDPSRPLIGVVGEIYCRLDDFANEQILRVIEAQGGEAWIADISEWIWYTNYRQLGVIREKGQRFTKTMLAAKIKNFIQHRDEKALLNLFREDFKGYEEPHHVTQVLKKSLPYLPHYGALGEMTVSSGKAMYLYEKGADGIVDVSPFTCMNGIICEAVYPKISRAHDNIPMKVFYFDGTRSDWDRDIGIFIELARNYREKKIRKRVYPNYFLTKEENLSRLETI
jgi:predicted nucleotide-binding protein (sugar kinase/HSP70/actin superfamily)